MPRVLADVATRDLSHRFLGMETGSPFGIAPMGMCNLTWPGADMMLARAADARAADPGVRFDSILDNA